MKYNELPIIGVDRENKVINFERFSIYKIGKRFRTYGFERPGKAEFRIAVLKFYAIFA